MAVGGGAHEGLLAVSECAIVSKVYESNEWNAGT